MAEALRKKSGDNVYTRPTEVETQINELMALTGEERTARFLIHDGNDPRFVRSESLLHFLRRQRGNSPRDYEKLYKILLERVKIALPGGWRRENGPVVASEERAASAALNRFVELLAGDYNAYEDRLDFFEIRFNAAVAALRKTAVLKERKADGREATLPDDPDAVDKIQTDSTGFNPFGIAKYSDPLYRIRMHAAIDALPTDQRMALILDLQGVPFTSDDPDVATVGSYIGCGEQSARQKRDKALKAVRIALEGDDK